MVQGILGKKIGMTETWRDGAMVPVTLLQPAPALSPSARPRPATATTPPSSG